MSFLQKKIAHHIKVDKNFEYHQCQKDFDPVSLPCFHLWIWECFLAELKFVQTHCTLITRVTWLKVLCTKFPHILHQLLSIHKSWSHAMEISKQIPPVIKCSRHVIRAKSTYLYRIWIELLSFITLMFLFQFCNFVVLALSKTESLYSMHISNFINRPTWGW